MLKIYIWERQVYPDFREANLCRKDIQKIVNKLVRHFKTRPIDRVYFSGYRTGAVYYSSSDTIGIGRTGYNLGTVCHEFAHHLTDQRWGAGHHHNRKFKRELKRVYTYAKRWLPEKSTPQIEYEQSSQVEPTIESARKCKLTLKPKEVQR